MRKLPKLMSIAMCMPLAAATLFACDGGQANREPEIVGASFIDCSIGQKIDLLHNIAAIDPEQGDITDRMLIDVSPYVEVVNGYAVFEKPGVYEAYYYVEDDDGESAEAYVDINVYERSVYRKFFDGNGFTVQTSGDAKLVSSGVTDGKYLCTVTGAQKPSDAALTRTFELVAGHTYNIDCSLTSSAMGTVRIFAGDTEIAQKQIERGDNSISFPYTVQLDIDEDRGETGEENAAATDEPPMQNVELSIQFGSLGDEINFGVGSVMCIDPDGAYTDCLDGFTFYNSNTFDRLDGAQGVEGRVEIGAGGSSATVEITKANPDRDWAGGMFINTGVPLGAGDRMRVSLDYSAQAPFSLLVQWQQWGPAAGSGRPSEMIQKFQMQAGENSRYVEFSVSPDQYGSLWLYVQTGDTLNRVTVSNIKVQKASAAAQSVKFDSVAYTPHPDVGGDGTVSVENGKIIYNVKSFGNVDWHNRIDSPSFEIDGMSAKYVISFKAKSTKAVKAAIGAPTAGGWDPNILFKEFTIGTEEQYYFFTTDKVNDTNDHVIAWQFGAAENQKYKNVVIEISDIRVSLRHSMLDKFD